jgi:hypothetical protein
MMISSRDSRLIYKKKTLKVLKKSSVTDELMMVVVVDDGHLVLSGGETYSLPPTLSFQSNGFKKIHFE